MAPAYWNGTRRSPLKTTLMSLAIFGILAIPAVQAQTGGSQPHSQQPASPKPAQEIPDAPSTVQPPAPKPELPEAPPPGATKGDEPAPAPGASSPSSSKDQAGPQSNPDQEAPPPMPPVQTIPAGTGPRNQINPKEDLYTISVSANFVQIPVSVKYSDGRPVEGLLSKDFSVLENGKKQTLTFFTSDPFPLSVAVLLDIGMPDVAVQKVNQTYSALVGAFSPYDEVAVYTYSSTVSKLADFTGKPERLTATLNQMKLVRGNYNGPPVLDGPLASGPTVNGFPVGGPPVQPVNTPPREAHVLNDAILRAALDLSKRERTRRKVIFVISNGRELGSNASYREVLRVLETQGIQVRAVVVDSGALPVYRQVNKLHLKGQGFADILPKYVSATGGGNISAELSRNAMENAYAQVTSDARNQYTLGYVPQATTGSSAYRDIDVRVGGHGKDLKIYAKAGYYAVPTAH